MMKRMVLCAVLMAAVLSLSAASLFMLRRCNDTLFERIDGCLAAYESGGDTSAEIERLEDYWGEYYVKVSFLTRSSSLDDISCSVARLKLMLDGESDEFAAELNSVRYRADLLYEAQIPHLRSVF